jgi:hypothetical protein
LRQALADRNYAVIAGASPFFIQEGVSGTESVLIEALNRNGDVRMAGVFLNCGNLSLETAAREWAEARGIRIVFSTDKSRSQGASSVEWGSGL